MLSTARKDFLSHFSFPQTVVCGLSLGSQPKTYTSTLIKQLEILIYKALTDASLQYLLISKVWTSSEALIYTLSCKDYRESNYYDEWKFYIKALTFSEIVKIF